MADVFVSYAREDAEFVDRLDAALTDRGRETWIDRTGIEPSDRWTQSAREAIERSDAFLFVLSRASTSSIACRLELDYAQSLNKRLIAICVEEPYADAEVPPAVAELSWIMMRREDDFGAAAEILIRALSTDLELVRTHTRILVRAKAWELGERRASPLLRGEELRMAEEWLAQASGTLTEPTELQREFIAASRRATVRRQYRIASVSVVVAIVAVALAIFALIQRSLAQQQRAVAQQQRDQARRERDLAQSRALAAQAQSLYQTGPLDLAMLLSIWAYKSAPTDQARSSLIRGLQTSRDMVVYTRPQSEGVSSVAVNYDGTRVVSTAPNAGVELEDLNSGRVMRTFGSDFYNDAAISPDGKWIAGASASGDAADVWNAQTGAAIHQLAMPNPPSGPPESGTVAVAFSPDGSELATVSGAGTVGIWSVRGGKLLRTLGRFGDGVGAISFSHDGRLLAAGTGFHDMVLVWDTVSGRQVAAMRDTGSVLCVAFSPVSHVVAAGRRGSIDLWNIDSGVRVRTLTGLGGGVNGLAFNPDGRTLASASDDSVVRLWDPSNGSLRHVFRGQFGGISSVAFAGDGRLLVSGAADKSVVVWNPAAGEGLAMPGGAAPVAWARTGAELLAASSNSNYLLGFDPKTGRRISSQPGPLDTHAFMVAISPDLKLAAFASGNNVRLWNEVADSPGRTLRYPSGGGVNAVAIALGDRTVVTANTNGFAIEWDTYTGGQEQTLTASNSGSADAVSFSPDGRTVAVGGSGASLWDAATGNFLRDLRGVRQVSQSAGVLSLAFSPDGKAVAAGTDAGAVVVSSVASGKPIRILPATSQMVESVAFASDGSTLAAGGDDGRVQLWDTASWQQLGDSFATAVGSVARLAFSPDGSMLAAGGYQDLAVFGLLPARRSAIATIARLCSVVRRDLTAAEWSEYFPGEPQRPSCGR